jgi:hypothetical protein
MTNGAGVMDKLATRLTTLPLILTGPILRRVTDKSVTVWIALRETALVTLQIRSGDISGAVNVGNAATRATVAVGRHIHIVAITAQVNLVPEVIYTYDLSFQLYTPAGAPAGTKSLLDKSALKPLDPENTNPINYLPFALPSFSLPPKDPNNLRIIHGSCRMPHGSGPDALSILDKLIDLTVENATQRPHQLLMTGDQIYADDVAAVLLMQLMDASNTLLGTDTSANFGWRAEETLPAGLPVGGPNYHTHRPSDYPPLSRTELLGTDGAGFTSADLRSHLMSLGEYLCMYLFAWSDVLWPKTLPTSDEVVAAAKAKMDLSHIDNLMIFYKDAGKVPGDLHDVQVFRETLPQVRRALANIPSYMVCDDHDVTDDWNMTPGFCNRVYHSDNPLGRRIVQNALVAYALCQLWGNTPEQFDVDSSNQPSAGRQLLNALDNKTSLDYDLKSASLQTIVGVHTADQLKARRQFGEIEGNFHDQTSSLTINGVQVSASSLAYNFHCEWPTHQIVFTDTRSWRAYRSKSNDVTADLLPPDQIDAQIPLTPDLGDRILLVVVTTNAPPVQPIRGATRHDTISTFVSSVFTSDSHPDLFEAWEIPSLSFDRLLKRLTDKLKPDGSFAHYGQVILLSGDVHHSFATRLLYRATNRFGDTQAQSALAVVAQLVASSFKKQSDDTIGFHRDGYFYVPIFLAKGLIRKDMTEGYVGWNVLPNSTPYKVGSAKETWQVGLSSYSVTIDIRDITSDGPTIQVYPLDQSFPRKVDEIDLTRIPDYRYRLDYILPSAQSSEFKFAERIPPMPGPGATPAQRQEAMKTFNEATANYRTHNNTPGREKVIGRNNIGELTFDWGKHDKEVDHKQVNHTLRWRYSLSPSDDAPDPVTAEVRWTTYTISLDPNDQKNYPSLAANVEGPRRFTKQIWTV